MGCLEKRKDPEIPEIIHETEKDIIDFEGIPKDYYICPKCGRIPEIKGVHTDNGFVDLKCKFHGIIKIKINKYFKEFEDSYYRLKCSNCGEKESERKKIIYCYKCKEDLCEDCIKIFRHVNQKIELDHLDYCIDAREKCDKCPEHIQEQITEYCEDCEENICPKERYSRHDGHNIKKIYRYLAEADEYRKIIEEKNKILEKIILFNRTILNSYNKFKNNYFHIKNVINVGKYLNEQFKRNSDEIDCFSKELENIHKKQEESIKALKKKKIILSEKEEKLHLNKVIKNRIIGNNELIMISKIYFTNLKGIELSGNEISDINCLANMSLPYLEYIDLSENRITMLICFNNMNLPNLEYIDLSHNQIKDISPIAKLKSKNLIAIYLQDNQIKDIKPFFDSDFPKLERLRIDSNNQIDKSDEDFKAFLKKNENKIIYEEYGIKQFLKEYKIERNYDIQINGETFGGELKKIDGDKKRKDKIEINDLDLNEAEFNKMINDLYSIIPKKNQIKKLILTNNKIKDASRLSRLFLPYLSILDLSINKISNLNFLNENNYQKIQEIFLNDNKINNIIPLDRFIDSIFKFYHDLNEQESNSSNSSGSSDSPKLNLICINENCFLDKGENKDNEDNKGEKIIVATKENQTYVSNWINKGIALDIENKKND